MEPNELGQAGNAELNAASSAIQQQDAGAAGARGDTRSNQLPPAQGNSRGLEFNPSNEPSSGAQPQQGANNTGVSGVAGLSGQTQGSQNAAGTDEWESIRDVVGSLGYQIPAHLSQGDDRAVLLHILNQAQQNQQANYYAQLGQAIAPQYQQFQQFLAQQQPQAQSQQRHEWEAPEFDREWLQLVDQDPRTGRYLAKPGVNPAIADRVNAFDRWQQQYGQNPVAPVRAMMQHELPAMIQQQVQAGIQQYQQQQTVQSIVTANAEWMYQNNAEGRPVIGVGGQPVFTPQGMRYGQLVHQLEKGGMHDPRMIDQTARNLLLGELAQGQLRGNQQQPNQTQVQNALAGGRSQTNPLQSLPAQQRQLTPGATEPDNTGMSLTEVLRRELAPYNDSDFRELNRY